MNSNIQAIYRRARLKSQHRAGFRAGTEQLQHKAILEKEEHYTQAFHTGQDAAIQGMSRGASEQILLENEVEFIHNVQLHQLTDEDLASENEAENDEADIDVSDIDVADWDVAGVDRADHDEADEDEADDIQ